VAPTIRKMGDAERRKKGTKLHPPRPERAQGERSTKNREGADYTVEESDRPSAKGKQS